MIAPPFRKISSHPARRRGSLGLELQLRQTQSPWIEEQLRNGRLPYRWIGNKRVIFRRDLDELMESLPVETGLCDVPAFMDKSQKGKEAA
jgi:hypothetical protein